MKITLTHPRQRRYAYLAGLLLTFIVLLPKGGIKMAGIPLTVGYALLFLLAGLSFTAYTYTGKLRWLGKNQFACLVAFVPFFVLSTVKILGAGFESLGFMMSFYISLFVVPAILLLLFYHPLKRVPFDFVRNLLLKFVFFTALYGIFLFFYKLYTGSFIEIPLLTVNVGDVGGLDDKHIDRGGIFKLISTYNNGNLYGVCMLMLLPFFNHFERRTYRRVLLKFALLLTLSRTVWISLLLFEVLNFVFIKKKTFGSVVTIALVVALVVSGVLAGLALLGRDASFLADRSLGGRSEQVTAFFESTFLPDVDRSFAVIQEMVYFSVADNFGWLGLIFFLVYLSTPLGLFLLRQVPQGASYTKKTLALGLLLYHVAAFVDGAILLIPVMAIYWLVVLLLLSNQPELLSRPDRILGKVLSQK